MLVGAGRNRLPAKLLGPLTPQSVGRLGYAARVNTTTTLSARKARTLLMQAQGLLDDPARRATIASLYRLIHRMGYVQLDSINVLERAHHLTLATRMDGYRPSQLTRLLEERRSLFEHWTHDASAIPSEFFPMWKNRFERHAKASDTPTPAMADRRNDMCHRARRSRPRPSPSV